MAKKPAKSTPAKKRTPKQGGRGTNRSAGNRQPAQKAKARPAASAGGNSKSRPASKTGGNRATPRLLPRKAGQPVIAAAPDLSAELGEAPAVPLTAEEVEEFRRLLFEKRSQLVGDVGTLQDEALRGSRRETSGDLSSMPVHMADLGTDNYEMEFTLGLLEGGRAVLHEIDEALERVRNGKYGICLATGKPIGKARLRAKPWAKFCYEYTLALEKGKRQGT